MSIGKCMRSSAIGACVWMFAACGGSGANINVGKLQAVRKVAVAGVCLQKQMGALRGTKSVMVFDGNGAKLMLSPLVASLNAALPAQWTGMEVLPFTPGAEPSNRAVGEHRVCANDLDPMTAEGFMGTPDKAYLGALANKLGVDAMLVVSGNPTIRFWSGKGAKAYVPSIGDGFHMTLVDRAGDTIAFIDLRNFETEYSVAAGTKDDGDVTKMGTSLGSLMATGFVAAIQGREFNPPSRPGMSGL